MRCGKCGNVNADANRFCGMCGAPLAAKTQTPVPGATAVAAGNKAPTAPPPVIPAPVVSRPTPQSPRPILTQVDTPSVERRPVPRTAPHPEPAITGPSFLGLGQPASGGDGGRHFDGPRESSGGDDHFRPSSGNLDYLLDDEEEHKGGVSKGMLFILALALAGGFGYLNWRHGGFEWLKGEKKAAVSAPDSSQPGADPGAPQGTAPNGSAGAPAVTPIPTDAAPANNAADSSAQNPAAQQTPADANPVPGAAAPSASTAPSPTPTQAAPSDSSAAADSAAHPAAADNSDSDQAGDEEAATPAPAKPAPRKPAVAKPAARSTVTKPAAAKPSAATPYDSVAEAERYIYGRGVAQDCDHGLHLLKPAAAQANPKAMISLGALYSTGTCTPRDLPTAYRWFAMALHKQPDNQVLQNDLQKLWSQMTQPERQLAIKLSQ